MMAGNHRRGSVTALSDHSAVGESGGGGGAGDGGGGLGRRRGDDCDSKMKRWRIKERRERGGGEER